MSEDNAFLGTVIVFSTISLVISAVLLLAQLVGLHDPTPSSLLWMSTVPFGAGLGFYVVGRLTQRKKSDWRYEAEPEPEPEPEGSKFCRDCGKLFELRQSQSGFDPRTGAPQLFYQLGCPDGDPTKPTRDYEAYSNTLMRSSGMFSGPFSGQRYRWPNCGTVTNRPLAPVGHLGHEPGAVSTECPKCIESMLAQNIIGIGDAKKLIAAIGKVE